VLLATRYHTAAVKEGDVPRDAALGFLAQALQQRARQTGESAGPATPIDVDLARALYLQSQMDLARASEDMRLAFGLVHVQCLTRGRHLDAAEEAAIAVLGALPPLQQLFPPPEYVEMRNRVRKSLEDARASLVGEDLRSLPPLQRAQALTTPERGLTLEAIGELRAAGTNLDPAGRMALGDFLLRLGRVSEARTEYQAAAKGGADPATENLRLALCDWVEGNLYAALDRLAGSQTRASTGPAGAGAPEAWPLREYYRGLLLEELGYYAQAKGALEAAAAGASPELAKRIEQARERL
jgi:tetratricopeptide (TPR) repeat protein